LLNDELVSSSFGNKIRVRVCGILIHEHQLLMALHKPFGPAGELWIPPGGGMIFGEDAVENLKREFIEETNLQITVGKLLFINEVIEHPYHSIELFFHVTGFQGKLELGSDPEIPIQKQILKEVRFLSENEINQIPINKLHNVFKYLKIKDGLISFGSLLEIKECFIPKEL